MANSRRKGADWERAVVAWLQGYAWPLARRAATPAEDQDLGDVVGIPGAALDCKNSKTPTIGVWMTQLDGIARRSGADIAALVIKRPRVTDPARAFVVADFDLWVKFAGVLDWDQPLWHVKGLSPKKFGPNLDLARNAAAVPGNAPVISFQQRGAERRLALTDLEFLARVINLNRGGEPFQARTES